MNSLALTLENERLRNLRKVYRDRIAILIERKEYLLSHEGPHLESLYLKEIGTLCYKVYVLDTEIAKLKLEVNLIQSYINKNTEINQQKIDEEIEEAAKLYKERLEAKAQAIKEAKAALNNPVLTPEESAKLKTAYHFIVKKLHPDLHPNPTEREKELFILAQIAYKNGDVQEMQNVLMQLEKNDQNEIIIDDLAKEVEHLKLMQEKLEKDIEKIEQRFPFTQRELLDTPELLSKKKEEINLEIAEKEKSRTNFQNYVNVLKLWKPGLLN